MLKYLISLLVIFLIYFIYLNLKKENIWMYWENKKKKIDQSILIYVLIL